MHRQWRCSPPRWHPRFCPCPRRRGYNPRESDSAFLWIHTGNSCGPYCRRGCPGSRRKCVPPYTAADCQYPCCSPNPQTQRCFSGRSPLFCGRRRWFWSPLPPRWWCSCPGCRRSSSSPHRRCRNRHPYSRFPAYTSCRSGCRNCAAGSCPPHPPGPGTLPNILR